MRRTRSEDDDPLVQFEGCIAFYEMAIATLRRALGFIFYVENDHDGER